MSPSFRYRLLGPVEVWTGEDPVPLAGPRVRNVLASLLLDAGRVVPVERLIDLLWDETPPRTAATALQGVVSQLRRALANGDRTDAPIRFQPPGYVITVGPGELDLHEFPRQVQSARQAMAAGEPAVASRALREALALWRGPALGGVTAEGLRRTEVPRLEELRLTALEDRIESDLRLGCHQEVVPELRSLVADHPYRERLLGLLMLALYRCGRQADALDAYREARQRSVEELGLDPGPEVQQLERAVLRRDPALDPPRAEAQANHTPAVEVPPPAGLPAGVRDFTGRTALVTELRRLLCDGAGRRGGPAVVVISGKPGVGKTALAVHVGHHLREVFPDGLLYAEVRGARESRESKVEPGEVLGSWLRELGMQAAAIPSGPDERARLYRGRLAGRRLLVVIDDAPDERTVRPLLPSTSGCAVLVTSRTRLTGLEGATHRELDVLTPAQAVCLLERVAGRERVAAEPEAAAAIVAACGCLPLAVRIAGARLAVRPEWPLSELAGRLHDQRHRLDELQAGDLQVRSSMAFSYAGLDGTGRRAWRLLAALDVRDFTVVAAGAMLGAEPRAAERLLEDLADRHLLEAARLDLAGSLRYRFHDLLHEYGRERREQEDASDVVTTALERAMRAYIEESEAAAARLAGVIPPLLLGLDLPDWAPPDPTVVDGLDERALAWFTVERENLVRLVVQAGQTGLDRAARRLAISLTPFFELGSHWDDWQRTHRAALEAAERNDDRSGRGAMLVGLGHLEFERGRYGRALDHFRAARREFGLIDHQVGQAAAVFGVGLVRWRTGQPAETVACCESILPVVRVCPLAEAVVLGYLARAQAELGRLSDAESSARHMIEIARAGRMARVEGLGLNCLGIVELERGRPERAVRSLRESLARMSGTGDLRCQAHVTYALAMACADLGRQGAARSHLDQALASL